MEQIAATFVGSSPLTRGKLHSAHFVRSMVGLIPAHAGKTRLSVIAPLILRAHPRSRGENALLGIQVFRVPGSSPLTRGKPHALIP